MPKTPTKFPLGTWERAAAIYQQRTGNSIKPKTLRGRYYATYDPDIQIAIDMAVEQLTAINNEEKRFDFELHYEYRDKKADTKQLLACLIRYWPAIVEESLYTNIGIIILDIDTHSSYIGAHCSSGVLSNHHTNFEKSHLNELYSFLIQCNTSIENCRVQYEHHNRFIGNIEANFLNHSIGHCTPFYLNRMVTVSYKVPPREYFSNVLKSFPNRKNELPS